MGAMCGFGRRMISKRSLLGCVAPIALFAAIELPCRAFGLHRPVLYEAAAYGYRVKPLQEIHRFGNRYFSNEFGLRSEPIAQWPARGMVRILCLGDSITNGGAVTDQAETYPYLLQRKLRANQANVEVLNASAPGWAVANAAGWLRFNGTFGAQVVLLTVGTADLFQAEESAAIVGRHPSFPSVSPALAVEELLRRYAMPRLARISSADPGTGEPSGATLASRQAEIHALRIAEHLRRLGVIPLVLYVERPVQTEAPDPHLTHARSSFFEAMTRHNIAFRSTRDAIERAGGAALFRDGLHPNAAGNRILAQVAAELLEPVISQGALPR
jgi:lysophospholipase L1-like esterase